MKPLSSPIGKVLRDELDHGSATRIWQGVRARRLARRKVRERRNVAFAFLAGLSAAVLLLFASGLTTTAPRAPVVVDVATAPLLPRSSVDWPNVAEPSEAPRAIEFTDGSRIALGAGGRLAPLENTGRSVVFLLKNGRADFDVVPGGPRRWSIEAGLATVEVVGTRFSVVRSPEQVIVEVEHGTVLVRGERVADRVQRLGAGEHLVIERATPTPTLVSAPPEAPSRPALPSDPRRAAPPVPAASAWRELAQEGAYVEAYRNLGAEGIAGRARTADLEQLLALADVARLSGHPRDSVAPLSRAMTDHAGDPRAAMAAFMLGRVHLDSLQEPAAAADDFRAAIALRLPSALVEDAHLRLIEASAKAGDSRAAREAWKKHRELFPSSSRQSIADRWGRDP